MLSDNEVLRAAWVLTTIQQSCRPFSGLLHRQAQGNPVLLCSHSNLHTESLRLAGIKQRMGPASL